MNTLADYERWKAERQNNNVGAAQIVLGATEGKPDEIAGDLNLANEFGKVTGNPVPPLPMVKEYRNVFQQRIEQERNRTILSSAPRMTEWLRNPDNAALARDDLKGLSWWENVLGAGRNSIARGVQRIPQSFNQFMANEAAKRADDQSRSFGDLLGDEMSVRSSAGENIGGKIIPGPEDLFWAGSRYLTSRLSMLGNDQRAVAADFQLRAGEINKRIAAIPMDPSGERYKQAFTALKPTGNIGDDLRQFFGTVAADPAGFSSFLAQTALESAPSIAAATAATLATRNPTVGATFMGTYSGVQEMGPAPVEFFAEHGIDVSTPEGALRAVSDANLMQKAQERGLIRGSIIGIMDGLSGGIAGKALAQNPAANLALQSIVQAAFGGGGEALAQVGAGQEFNIAEVMLEGLAEFVTAPVEVAGVGGRAFLDGQRKARDAESRVQLFQELSGQAQQSALRNRMPDKFREFVAEATRDGPVENIYIPAQDFVTYFQGVGVDPYALIEGLDGVTRDDLDIALAGGGDLQIPTATYAAKIAGSEHDAFLMENMRFDPEQFTAREAAEFNERAQEAMEEAWLVAEDLRLEQEQLRSFEQQIYDTMVSRLRAAGRSTDVATTEAMLYPAFYRVMAERSGMSTEEFMLRYPLPEVRGDLPQGMQLRDTDALSRTLAEARARKSAGLAKRGPSLLEFISERGGINDVGGELRSRNAETISRGRGKKTLRLSRAGAVNAVRDMLGGGATKYGADDVAQAVIEAGYLADDPDALAYQEALRTGGQAPDITAALWGAIDRELRGEAQYRASAEADAKDQNEAALDEVERYLAEIGVSLDEDDATIRAAIDADQAGRAYGQSTPENRAKNIAGAEEFVSRLGPDFVAATEVATGGSVYVQVKERLKNKDGSYKKRNGEAWIGYGGFKVRFADHGAYWGTTISIDPISGNTVDDAIALLNYASGRSDSAPAFNVSFIEPSSGAQYRAPATYKRGSTVSPVNYSDADKVLVQAGRRYEQGGALDASGPRLLFQNTGGPRGSIQFPATGVGNGDTVIRLFQSANLSTMLHESGHYFLTVMQDLASLGEQSSVTDFATIKAWWRENAAAVAKDAMRVMPDVAVTAEDVMRAIDTGSTGDVMLDGAIDVGMQEQFARGFEAYLMEGKAPSAELRTAFEKFRAWLISVYRKLAGLNVTISDDIRAVFDRMIATDEEIAKAKSEAGDSGPIFANAEQMGLTQEEFEAFTKLRTQAEDEAKARLLRETMEPIKREQEKWFKEERAKVRDEVEREVNAYPAYRAIEWMGNRRWIGDVGQPDAMQDMRLSKDILVSRYGEGVLKTLPRGKQTVYAVEGGLDPDDAAGWFGFDSGDEMIRAMEQQPPRKEAIEAETDKLMRERHGDPLNDGSVEALALDAVHTDKRGQWIAVELEAVRKVMGGDARMTAKEARATARQTVARMRVRDAMNANRFLAAERKAAEQAQQLAGRLSSEGYWETRANFMKHGEGGAPVLPPDYRDQVAALYAAKRRQLLNHALYMEARKVADEVEKAENFVTKLNKKTTRDRIAGAGRRENASIDYLAAIDEILDRYDFRRMSGAAEQRRGALAAFIEGMKATGRENELAIPEHVLADAASKPYKTISVEELRGVIDSLKNLEHIAARWNKLIDAKQQRELEEVVAEIVGAFDKNLPKRPPGRVRTRGEGVKNAGRQFLDLILNATTLLREIDGFEDEGPAYRNIKAPIDEAMTRLIDRKEKATIDLEGLYGVYTSEERRRMSVREHMPELGYSLSKWERIAVALNTGNDGNFQRLTDKKVRGSLTEAQVTAVLATLDERDAKFVQSVWDYVNSFWPDIVERERRVTGTEPQKVEARPVTIAGQQLRGGYYPIKYDPRLSSLARDDEMQEISQALQAGRFGKAQTRNGHLKERAQSSGRDVELDMSVLHRHINQVIYDLELSEPVANSWRILQSGQVRGAFMEAGKQADFDALEIWLKDVAEGELKSADFVNRTARMLKTNFTAAKLAFNLSTVMMQVSGVSQSMVVVGKKNMAIGIQQSFRAGVGDEIAAKSAFMRTRQSTFNKDVFDFYNDPTMGPVVSRWGEFKTTFGKLGFWLMTKVQWYAADVPTWLAGYHQGLAKFKGDEGRAIAHADSIVKRAQASGLFSDRSAVERGSLSNKARQNDVVRMFTALGSYMFAKFNVAYERTARARRVVGDEGFSAKSAQEALSWTLDMAFLFTLEALIVAAIKGKFPSDDDDDDDDGWLKFLAKETALSVMGTIPFVRDLSGPLQGFSGGGAYGAITEEFTKPIGQAMQGEADAAFVKSVISATGLATGMPATQINRAVDAAYRSAEGEDVSPLEYILGRSKK